MRRPILVTGAHRTGTTWVGDMLARARRMYYVHEPFSPNRGGTGDHANGQTIFDRWYSFIDDENTEDIRARLEQEIFDGPEAMTAKGESDLANAEVDSPRVGLLDSARKALRPLRRGVDPILPVVKDPVALLSAPWLARHFDMNVVVMVRHPAAFAASIARQGWAFPFADLASQPRLMSGPLKEFADVILDFAKTEREILEQAGLIWKILYSVVIEYRREHSDWHFVVYEDLARDPAAGFRNLYSKMGLRGVDPALRLLEAERRASPSLHDPKGWQRELDPVAIMRLREATDPVWREFYRDGDWS